MEKVYVTKCCNKEVQWEEYAINHGWCNECLNPLIDKGEQEAEQYYCATCPNPIEKLEDMCCPSCTEFYNDYADESARNDIDQDTFRKGEF